MGNLGKRINDIPLKNKLILIYVSIGIIPIVILLIFCYHQMNQLILEKETTTFQSYLHQTAENLENQIAIYDDLSNYIVFNDTISDVVRYQDNSYRSYEQISKFLDPTISSLRCFHKEVEQITVYTECVKVEHDTTLIPYEELSEETWLETVEQDNQIHWFVSAEGKDRKVFSARCMPAMLQNGNQGILYIQIAYDSIFSVFEQVLRLNYGIYILDRYGRLVYDYSQYEEGYQQYALSLEKFKEEYRKNDGSYTFLTENLEETGWKAVLYTPTAMIVSYTQPLILISVVALMLCSCAMVLLLMVTSKLIVSRLTGLICAINDVRKGNMDTFIEENTDKDEIGALIRSFHEMMERLRFLINEVYESRITQKKLEMRALQAQINPHFLYNSLSLINWKALEADQEEISKITLALSAFYRTSLNKGKNILKIRDELNNMSSYMEIQLIMHDYEFDFEVEAEEEIMEYETLNLILQPLVENAIDHGIDLKTDGERGRIKIRGWKEQEEICLSVEDNGVGMEEEKFRNLVTTKSKGYGVRNIDERIKLYYGEEYGIYAESRAGVGTKVTVRFPVKEFKDRED